MSYSHRIADLQLAERLEAFGAVLIEGPKWCGKTTTAEQMSKSVIKMQDTEMQEEYAATAAFKNIVGLSQNGVLWVFIWQS